MNACKGKTAVELRFSFVPGFAEYTIHVRGSLAAATVDFERNTYTLDEHRPCDPDFESYAMIVSRAKSLKRQARRNLWKYVLSKMHLCARGSPYGASIARAMDAFYGPLNLDERVDGRTGAKVIRICEKLGELANLPAEELVEWTAPTVVQTAAAPHILVLGGTGFIGKELVRQLIASGHTVRLLVRSAPGFRRNCGSQEAGLPDWGFGKRPGFAAGHGGGGVRLPPGAGQREELGGLRRWRLRRRGEWASARWKRE